MIQKESHRSGRIGWLRAVVLGANDGLIWLQASSLEWPFLAVYADFASAISFAFGAIVSIVAVVLAPFGWVTEVSSATALATLLILGGTAAYAGGASMVRGAVRVAVWGALAGSQQAWGNSSAQLYSRIWPVRQLLRLGAVKRQVELKRPS